MLMIDDYKLEKKLGSGSYGEVYYTTKKNSNQIFATKKVDKKRAMAPLQKSYFLNEIDILKSTDHENIIKLFEIKNSENNFYMIMEYCNGGSLLENYNSYYLKHYSPMPEIYVQHILRQIACGLFYLHKCDIIHRDLKLENILLHYETEEDKKDFNVLNAKIKIIDFGFAKYLTASHIARSVCGSPLNMDPIILEALAFDKPEEQVNYNEKADIWSLGIIVYHLLIGRTPYTGSSYKDLYAKVDKGTYNIPKALKLSKQAISLINGLLQFELKDRISIDQLIYDEFLIKDVKDFEYFDLNLKESAEKNIVLSNKEDCSKIWDMYKTNTNTNLSTLKGKLQRNSIIINEQAYKPNFCREINGLDSIKNIFEKNFYANINKNNHHLNDLNYNNYDKGYYFINKIDNNKENINYNKIQFENEISHKISNFNNNVYNNNYLNNNNNCNGYSNFDNLNIKGEKYYACDYYNKNDNVNNFNECSNTNYNKMTTNILNNNCYKENFNNKKSESNKDIFSFRRNNVNEFDVKQAYYDNNRNSNCGLNSNYNNINLQGMNVFSNHGNRIVKPIEDNTNINHYNNPDKYQVIKKESEKLHELIGKMKSDLEKDKLKPIPNYYSNYKSSINDIETRPFDNSFENRNIPKYYSSNNINGYYYSSSNNYNGERGNFNNYNNDAKKNYGLYDNKVDVNRKNLHGNVNNKDNYYIPDFTKHY